MASPNLSELLTSTLANRSEEVADNVTDSNAILKWMQKRGSIKTCDGGTTIEENLDYAENPNGGSFSGYDIIPMAASDVLTTASYGWKEYAASVMISGREMSINSGKSKILDLMDARIKNAKATLANLIALGLYSDGTGNGGKDITGLAAAVPDDPTTGTYGDINRATWPFWRSQVEDTAATVAASTIQPAMNSLYVKTTRGTDHVNLILAGSSIYQIFEASLQPLQRFANADEADLGFTTLKYKGASVVLDGGIGGNQNTLKMHFLNTNYLKWRPHKDVNFVPLGPDRRHPINQNAVGAIIGFMGNMTCSGAQFQGILIGT